ncbi:hypothetical protein SCACP_06740 [Sporomusa carbonis]|uniref:hypothetical protein n=1 Tax=Sporomusa carbonis TaxID=3076075 RepID=UPI003A7256D6
MVVIKSKNSVQAPEPERYLSLNEFINDMQSYEEIVFEYSGKKYIVTYYDAQLSIAEWNKPATKQTFASLEAFTENFSIDGKVFKDFVTKINIIVR